METRAIARYIRVSPQKARLVVDLVRGKGVGEALDILAFVRKSAASPVAKVLRSAVANAENTRKVDVDKLYVKKIYVDQGPTMKRIHARAMGRAAVVRKRMSHITVVLDER